MTSSPSPRNDATDSAAHGSSAANNAESRERAGTPLPALIDIAAVAASLGVTQRHVRRLVTERRIPFVKIGYFVRFDPTEVARWVDEHRVDVADRGVRRTRT